MTHAIIARFMLGAVLVFAGCSPAVSEKTATSAGSSGAAAIGDAQRGISLYRTNCASCHGATGVEGGAIGPSLRHENTRMDFAATIAWIEDPAPPMPKLYPKPLTAQDVRDVAAYVQSL
jgi:mono/diheme cytochrome c family protein